VAEGILSKETLDPLLQEMDASDLNLQQILLSKSLVTEKELLKIVGGKLKLKIQEMRTFKVDPKLLEKVPVKIASYYRFLPLSLKGRTLTVAVNCPLDIKTQDEIRTQLGYEIEMVLCLENELNDALQKYYGVGADTVASMSAKRIPDHAKDTQMITRDEIQDIEKLAGDASVIKLVNQIILEGWRKRATDIHIEPYRSEVTLRYRIDGVLYDANVSASVKNFIGAIISRIKIMSNLNIVERRLPQDGRAVVKAQEQLLDLRISTIPTPYGESVVIRLLPTERLFSLEKLGLSAVDLRSFEHLIQKPHGIIFVTGPTGSGKTTSLYASLNRINTKERKIITIEDPIEYEMPGVTQMQVMPDIGLDFARGLRSILRHDPDVIMVGEVRDLETAQIAIRVALTGHLIFSTLHTNDAASGITRLVDIGVEPYLVSSSVEAFIAQRLLRVICHDCKQVDQLVPQDLKAMIARDMELDMTQVKVYHGKGCSQCNFTGYLGRTAIYEILLLDDEIKDLVVRKSPVNHIKQLAISKGMRVLRQDGWQKVLSGISTTEEIMQMTPMMDPKIDFLKTSHPSPKIKVPEPLVNETPPDESEEDSGRRVYHRLFRALNISYKVYHSQKELLKNVFKSEHLAVTKNISAGGILLVVQNVMPVGSILDIKMDLPGEDIPVQCLAKVARVDEATQPKTFNVAVYFLDITSAARARLNRYVDAQLKES